MRRESRVRFCEGLRGRFPRATRLAAGNLHRWRRGRMNRSAQENRKAQFRSPIEIIGVAAMACNSIFAVAASYLKDPISFKYCIHMFLGILAFLLLTAIWSPASLYHPSDLQDVSEISLPPSRPWVPTICMVVAVLIYMVYQFVMAKYGLRQPGMN